MVAATYDEIREYLAGVPMASMSWADGLFAAGLTITAVQQFITTMSRDPESPLRQAEAGMLSKEILKLNKERGLVSSSGDAGGKMMVRLKAVLSPPEQTRTMRLVQNFCQPVFVPSSKFGRNGHAVMNAVRRCASACLITKVPVGASIVEVGPDVKHWLLEESPEQWAGENRGMYRGSRPVLTPRDSVRVDWGDLVELVAENRHGLWAEEVVDKARLVRNSYDDFFSFKKIQDAPFRGEYIVSGDSNYDINFGDMPVAMMACGARAWLGVMVRAKGLTRQTRLSSGTLDLMGASYVVNWDKSRIDFRHSSCSAFGYSHNVWEYLKYEERNGYVWTTRDAHYVYSKSPETNSELLFFSVFRVPKACYMMEPTFTAHPYAGKLEVQSLWSVGDEISGVPTSFEKVLFYVDKLNFSKVLEKRRAIDCLGTLAATIGLVRSTNVRFWVNGTPVGAGTKIEARLAEATAVVVEVLAMQGRLKANLTFEAAMRGYEQAVKCDSWFKQLLAGVVDMRAMTGRATASAVRMWDSLRSYCLDAAVGGLSDLKVSVREIGPHVSLGVQEPEVLEAPAAAQGTVSSCLCSEIRECRAALMFLEPDEQGDVLAYLAEIAEGEICRWCLERQDVAVVGLGSFEPTVEVSDESTDETIASSDWSSSAIEESVTTATSEAEFEVREEDSVSWRSECKLDSPESASMVEFTNLERYLIDAQLSELKLDAGRLLRAGVVPSHKELAAASTSRTKHAVVRVMGGRIVESRGPGWKDPGAVYDVERAVIVPVERTQVGNRLRTHDGWYYTCNRLKVWNGPDLIHAVEHALDYGAVADYRKLYDVTLGVPGSGKTYGMMKTLAAEWEQGREDFLVLAVTKASAKAALGYAVEFGMPESRVASKIMTLDSYLINNKSRSRLVCVDEFTMVHVGKVDAAVSLASASVVRLFGDARQIPYDSFCKEFPVKCARLGRTVDRERITFLSETHRCPRDVCAAFVDQYPAFYPCKCCGDWELKQRAGMSWSRLRSTGEIDYVPGARYHTYKQEEREELRTILGLRDDVESLRLMPRGGLATVHEDQGSTHEQVKTVRLSTVYDKNASLRNPSLYNRLNYVLTDITRTKGSYEYLTMCAEDDLVIKRIELSKDPRRLACVDARLGLVEVDVAEMLD